MAFLVPPGPELQALIRKEVNEDLETRDASLRAIKDWLAKEPHLPDTWDDVRLLNFLRCCNFSLEKCKKRLDLYFTMRAAAPEIFSNRDIKRPEMQKVSEKAHAPILPHLTPEGRRVCVMGGDKNFLEDSRMDDAVKVLFMMEDICLGEETFGNAGKVYILDARVISTAFLTNVSFSSVKKYFICLQNAYPIKIKEFHVVNASSLFDLLFRMLKPFLKEKFVKRFHIHRGGHETLHKFVPKEILPEECGGTGGKLIDVYNEWMKRLEEYTPWFKEQEDVKADESKRPGKPTNYDELFGIEGSFRQLNID